MYGRPWILSKLREKFLECWLCKMLIQDALLLIRTAVRRGDLAEAQRIGAKAVIPLSVTREQLQFGPVLGNGKQATVYKGQWRGTPVAIKQFKITRASDLDRFRLELQTLGELDHPNIVPLLGACAVPPHYMLIVPLASGHVHAATVEQLADAVAYIHSLGIIHGDLKPSNVLSSPTGAIWLSDFGSGTTLEYMAPELLLRQPRSSASDVYALAITINQLATGTYPYTDRFKDAPDPHTMLEHNYSRQELTTAIMSGLRPTEHNSLQHILRWGWARDPNVRPCAARIKQQLSGLSVTPQTALPLVEKGTLNSQPCYSDAHMGVHATPGRRDAMEDAHLLVHKPGMQLVAVFDGHGGPHAALFAASHLEAALHSSDMTGAFMCLHESICRLSHDGTTALAALITEAGLVVGNAGDS